jgi:ribosomal protein S18 acetylase RimI-like enzyme
MSIPVEEYKPLTSGGTGITLVNVQIQKATVNDAPEILELQKLAYQSEAAIYDDYTIAPLTQTLDGMISDIRKQIVLKVKVGDKIVGSVRGRVQDGTGCVGRLMVLPEFQGQGIGTLLLQAIEEQMGQAERYELYTGHKSERNIRLYQKLGYRIFRSEHTNERLTTVYMEKRRSL